jgi:hypothetical protein
MVADPADIAWRELAVPRQKLKYPVAMHECIQDIKR